MRRKDQYYFRLKGQKMKKKYEKYIGTILATIDDVEKQLGEEFLELMITRMTTRDNEGNEIAELDGMEFGLIRSKHWDKEENLIFHDGIEPDNISEAIEALDIEEDPEIQMINVVCDGMTDLEEPINFDFDVKI